MDRSPLVLEKGEVPVGVGVHNTHLDGYAVPEPASAEAKASPADSEVREALIGCGVSTLDFAASNV